MPGASRRSEVLALIPARGGSKAIPRKNVRIVAGKPLIAYSIAHALASRRVTRTIVSTDDEEIARVAREFGAEVPFMRPPEFAQDASLDIDVFRHALGWLRDREGYSCELVVHLRPTGPVRRVEVIDRAIDLMLGRPDADSLRSVSWPTETPYKMWKIIDGFLEPLLDLPGVVEPYSTPRQALPEVYWQNGYVDIVRPRVVLEDSRMGGRAILPFVIDDPIFEIDYEDSIPAVEAALARQQRGAAPVGPGVVKRHPA
jgi:N-acylneuraminate cytidylyltransferase